MNIDIIGAGPAGMYAALRAQVIMPTAKIHVYERQSRDAALSGVGYTLSNDILNYFDDIGCGSLLESQIQCRWQTAKIVFGDAELVGECQYPLHGIRRSDLMTVLHDAATYHDIAVHYGCSGQLGSADFTIVASGSATTFSEKEKSLIGMRVQEYPIKYAWFSSPKKHQTFTSSVFETPVPYVVVSYPISSYEQANVLQVHADNVAQLQKEQPRLNFRSLALKSTARPAALANRCIIGEAAYTPYFMSGVGLHCAFKQASTVVDLLARNILPDNHDEYDKVLTRYVAAVESVLPVNAGCMAKALSEPFDLKTRVQMVTGIAPERLLNL